MDADPCNIYVSMEHAAGCPEYDLRPFLTILGASMIFAGVVLLMFTGSRVQKYFMRTIVNIVTFVVIMAVCFKLNWLALFDPTEPDANKSVFLAFFAILLATIGMIIVHYIFRKSMQFGSTLIGLGAGFWFSIYLIAAINGIGGMFLPVPSQAGQSYDIIGPVWGAVIEAMVTLLGGMMGYHYAYAFIIFIQTFVSSYLMVRGSTLIVNLGFPNEIQLMQSVSNETNGLMKLPTMFYVYSSLILGIWGYTFYNSLKKVLDDGTYNKMGYDSD